jgi:RNA polymerase sigma factor (TIGR02999 family)
MSEVTQILETMGRDDPHAAEKLLPLVYDELRKLAAQRMAREAPGQTLQPTALVHEAWLRLIGAEAATFENRGHFFAAAAEAMRRILIDRARRRSARKHGAGWERINLEQIDVPDRASDDALLQVAEAVEALSREDARVAKFVKLRFFCGLSVEDAARALGVTDRTARRDWRFARAWLFNALSRSR